MISVPWSQSSALFNLIIMTNFYCFKILNYKIP